MDQLIKEYSSLLDEESDFDNINEAGFMLTLRIVPLVFRRDLKRLLNGDRFDPDDLKEHMMLVVNKCKTVEDIRYLKRDRTLAIGQLSTMISNIEGYQKNPETFKKSFSSYYRKQIDEGKLKATDVKKYQQWLKKDYLEILNNKEKELKK